MATVQLFIGFVGEPHIPIGTFGGAFSHTHGSSDWGATEGMFADLRFPIGGTASNLNVLFSGIPNTPCEYALETRSSDPDSSRLLVNIGPLETSGDSGNQRLRIEAGDDFHMRLQGTGFTANAIRTKHSFLFVPDTSAKFCYGSTAVLPSAGDRWCSLLPSTGAAAPLRFDAEILCPIPGTVSDLYVDLEHAPGSGKSRSFTFRKNNAPQTVALTIADLFREGDDTANSFAVAAGDTIGVLSVPTNSPTQGWAKVSFLFTPTDGESAIWATASTANLTTTGDRYTHPWATRGNFTVLAQTDALCFPKGNEFELTALYARLSGAPGEGPPVTNYRFESWKNGALATDILVTISGINTSGNDSGSIFLNNGDVFGMQLDPSGGKEGGQPAAVRAQTAYAVRHVRKPTVRILGGRIKGGRIATL